MRSLKPEGRKTSLQNPYTDLPAQASEEFDEGGELDIGMALLDAGDETFLGPNPGCQLFLGKARPEPLAFELFSDNEGVALHFELIPLWGSYLSEILGNEVFDRCHVFLEAILIHWSGCFSVQNTSSLMFRPFQFARSASSGSFSGTR